MEIEQNQQQQKKDIKEQKQEQQQIQDIGKEKQKKFPEIGLGKLSKVQANFLAQKCPNGLSQEDILHLDQKGYLIVENILNKKEQLQGIQQLWDVLENVPNKPNFKITRPSDPLGDLSTEQQRVFHRNWVPWKSYGMLSEPGVWHTETHWKLRQNEKLYQMFCQIMQTKYLWASIDRASVKLPKEGNEEFNHWDFDPWHPVKSNVQGIVNLSERSFRCVPGSNTEEWHEDFKKEYTYLESKTPRSSVQLQQGQDPWKLGEILQNSEKIQAKTKYNCIRNIVCPAGSIVLFSQRTMHSVSKNISDRFSYGIYFTFIPAGNKLTHAVYNKKVTSIHAIEGHTERADRIRSYEQGTGPYKYPCGAGVFNYIMQRTIFTYMKKRREDSFRPHPNTGKDTILEPLPVNYNPPKLTKLGRLTLGIDLYKGMEEQPMKLSEQGMFQLAKK